MNSKNRRDWTVLTHCRVRAAGAIPFAWPLRTGRDFRAGTYRDSRGADYDPGTGTDCLSFQAVTSTIDDRDCVYCRLRRYIAGAGVGQTPRKNIQRPIHSLLKPPKPA